ncbi:DUF4222 domain-containing protein [Pantoea piersonii]|uniref:DUF4222 domain-containing protein n=1 Tax=Pantoea piersonii TaxID=2364647 RepID=UPI0028AD37BD|nr:DUF4222 domain-containing protein [Pantoea piersonii]
MNKPTSQPESQQRYKDSGGELIPVNNVQFNRVMSCQDSYSSPCKQLPERFMRDFTEVKP